MKRNVPLTVIAAGVLLMFLSIHVQGWLIDFVLKIIPYQHMSATFLLLTLSLTVLLPTFLVLFPLAGRFGKEALRSKDWQWDLLAC